MSKTGTTLEQLRDLPDVELQQTLVRTRDELFRLHLGQHTNQVSSTAQLVTKRRDIARILTVLRGRKLGFEAQAQKQAAEAGGEAATTDDKPAAKATRKKAKS